MTNVQDGKPSDRKGSTTVCEGFTWVNSAVTMHIISSLSSMDVANRLFVISGCGGE